MPPPASGKALLISDPSSPTVAAPGAAAPAPAGAATSMVTVCVGAAATSIWIATRAHISPSAQLLLLAPALAAWLWTIDRATRRKAVPVWVTLIATGVVLVTAVITPPSGSRDVWAYVMYGRMVAVHDANPYIVSPSAVPEDPLLGQMAPGWRDTRSVYGPLFTGVSAAGAALSGDSPTRNRLFHQALAALAVMVVLMMVWRRRGPDVVPLVVLGLSPPVAAVVNAGHNDLLVGACILGGVLAMSERRPMIGGFLVAASALVKVVALLPALALTIWAWRWWGRRTAASFAAVVVSVPVLAYAAVGGRAAIRPLLEADHVISRGSSWASPLPALTRLLRVPDADASVPEVVHLIYVAAPLLIVAVLVASLWLTRWPSPAPAATAAALAFLVIWPYVLPWYAMWSLVTAAGEPRAWTSRLAVALSFGLLLAYVDLPGHQPSTGLLRVLSGGAPVLALVIWAALELRARRPVPASGHA